jgi:hypothetical protein
VGYHEGLSNAMKDHFLLQANSIKEKCLSIKVSISSTPEMAISTATSQTPRRRRSHGFFTIFHKEVTVASTVKPTRISLSKSNKSHGLSLELIVMESSTLMQGCKSKNI